MAAAPRQPSPCLPGPPAGASLRGVGLAPPSLREQLLSRHLMRGLLARGKRGKEGSPAREPDRGPGNKHALEEPA